MPIQEVRKMAGEKVSLVPKRILEGNHRKGGPQEKRDEKELKEDGEG